MVYIILFGLVIILFIFLALKFVEMTFYRSKYEEANPTQQKDIEEEIAIEAEKLFNVIKEKAIEFWEKNKPKKFFK